MVLNDFNNFQEIRIVFTLMKTNTFAGSRRQSCSFRILWNTKVCHLCDLEFVFLLSGSYAFHKSARHMAQFDSCLLVFFTCSLMNFSFYFLMKNGNWFEPWNTKSFKSMWKKNRSQKGNSIYSWYIFIK